MPDNKQPLVDRRGFLRRVAASCTVAAGAAAATLADAQAYDPGSEQTRARYVESEHVKAFYRTNGYETLKK